MLVMSVSLVPGFLFLPDGYEVVLCRCSSGVCRRRVRALVVVVSGSTHLMMGDLGEQWTREELEGLRRAGWRLVNGVRLRPAGDLDHVLIGPGVVVVVETKWGSADWTPAPTRSY